MKISSNLFLLILLSFFQPICLISNVFGEGNIPGNQDNPYVGEARTRFEAGQVREDFLIPTSPAFAVLGVTPKEVIRPDTPKALGAALLNGVDSEGNPQSGVAIDVSPVYLFQGRNLRLQEYRKSLSNRLANRLQMSLATTRGSDESDPSLRLALGLRLAILDDADPRTNKFLDRCYDGTTSEMDPMKKEGGTSDLLAMLETARGAVGPSQAKLSAIRFSSMLIKKELAKANRASPQEIIDFDLEALIKKLLKPDNNDDISELVVKVQLTENELGKLKEAELLDRAETSLEALTKSQLEILEFNLIKPDIEYEEKYAAAKANVSEIEANAEKSLQDLWTACNEKFEKQNWNATNFTVGLAPIFFSEKGDFGDLAGSGIALYGTFAYGFDHIFGLEDSSQLILHARYRTNEQVADPSVTGSFIEQDLFVAGGQLRVAGPDIGGRIGGRDLTFFGEIDYRYADPEGHSNDSSYRYAFGMDLKVMEGTTLSLTVGDESGDAVGRSSSFAVGNLKWGF